MSDNTSEFMHLTTVTTVLLKITTTPPLDVEELILKRKSTICLFTSFS